MKFKILIILVIIVSITGCKKEINKNNNNNKEILLARDCGLEDLMCCNEKPQCFSGLQCCVSPLNKSDTYCAIDCGSGKKGQFCHPNNKCDEGFVCKNDRCFACGQKENFCCADEKKCFGDLVCYQDKCSECGKNDQPCCAGNVCDNSDQINRKRTECKSGVCSYCGFDGLSACSGDLKCIDNHIYSNHFCHQCGGDNQPCCNDDSSTNYQCDPKKNLKCELGFCVKKGNF